MLGADADETVNYQNAALKASNEIYGLAGHRPVFCLVQPWLQPGKLQDYGGAARLMMNPSRFTPSSRKLSDPGACCGTRPALISPIFIPSAITTCCILADGTLNAMQSDKNLEESYYWRAMAKAALGDTSGAIEDFRTSLQYHPGFEPAIYQLKSLGVEI